MALRFPTLLTRFSRTLESSGASVIVEQGQRRPARVRVCTEDGTADCYVYLWTVTHGGGRERPAHEQRIQMTGVDRILLHPRRATVLGGWSEGLQVFAFWDARRHIGFTPGSPSLQVREETLQEAAVRGVATELRDVAEGEETVVALTGESLLWYVMGGRAIHGAREELAFLPQLVEATVEEEEAILDGTEEATARARRYELVQVMRPYRNVRFRQHVLAAYRHRCAVCQTALRLVDAAHIVPITEPDGSDSVRNGIALCRLHHGAYDNSLLGVQSTYRLIVNPKAARHLRETGFDGGLDAFRAALPPAIAVPDERNSWPAPPNLRRGLEVRRWPRQLIA